VSTHRLIVAAALGLFACNQRSAPVTTPTPEPEPVRALDEGLVRDLSILTTQAEPTAAVKTLAARGDLEGVISMLVEARTFTHVVAPNILLEDNRFPAVYAVQELQLQIDPKTEIGYLYQPCKPSDATSVEPWWAMGTRIKVCNDSYKPDVFAMPRSKERPNDPPPMCGSNRGVAPPCGCGPNLIRCYRDRDQLTEVRKRLYAEDLDTIGHVINAGLPLQEIYTTNATVRDLVTETRYRMHDAARGEPWTKGLEKFGTEPTLQPRAEAFPGMHAGILTTPNFIRIGDAPRTTMMMFFQTMTCTGVDGAQVSAHQALGIDTASIRNESGGGNFLATTPGCSGCHARLENSIPFFASWRSVFHSLETEPELQTIKDGKIYLNDIDDLRATTLTTPAAFAKVVTAQPEFSTCQAGRIANFVHGVDHVDPGVVQELAGMIAAQKPVRDVFKTALLHYARRIMAGAPPKPAIATQPPRAQRFDVAAERHFDATTVKALEVCTDCHSTGDRWIDKAVTTNTVSALHALRMADVVASGSMPKGTSLSDPEREALVTLLAQAAWGDAETGKETANFMLGNNRPAAVHEFTTIVQMIDRPDPPPAEPYMAPEYMTKPGYYFLTPGIATTLGFEALRVCRLRSPSNVEECVNKILDDEGKYQRPAGASN
jgi:hypothetical protein